MSSLKIDIPILIGKIIKGMVLELFNFLKEIFTKEILKIQFHKEMAYGYFRMEMYTEDN